MPVLMKGASAGVQRVLEGASVGVGVNMFC